MNMGIHDKYPLYLYF